MPQRPPRSGRGRWRYSRLSVCHPEEAAWAQAGPNRQGGPREQVSGLGCRTESLENTSPRPSSSTAVSEYVRQSVPFGIRDQYMSWLFCYLQNHVP